MKFKKNRKKKEARLFFEEEPKTCIPPEKDNYGFERTLRSLKENNFLAEQVSGVIWVRLSKDNDFNKAYKEVEHIIEEQKFLGSWGVSNKEV